MNTNTGMRRWNTNMPILTTTDTMNMPMSLCEPVRTATGTAIRRCATGIRTRPTPITPTSIEGGQAAWF